MVEREKGAIEISNSHQTKNNIGNGGKYTVFQKANLSCKPEFINSVDSLEHGFSSIFR